MDPDSSTRLDSNFSEMSPQLTEDPSLQSEPAAAMAADGHSLPERKSRAGLVGRLLHGAGAGAFSYGLSIVSNLLLLPLYLRFWSVAIYGEWMALSLRSTTWPTSISD